MILIELPETESIIVKNNNRQIYCAIYPGLKGLFRKDTCVTRKFGREVCDYVQHLMNNGGFFTCDELPNYGISQEEFDYIISITKPNKNDLLVFFAYPENEAKKTKQVFDKIIMEKELPIR